MSCIDLYFSLYLTLYAYIYEYVYVLCQRITSEFCVQGERTARLGLKTLSTQNQFFVAYFLAAINKFCVFDPNEYLCLINLYFEIF